MKADPARAAMKMLMAYSVIAVLAMTAELLWPARKKAFFRPGLFTDGIYVVVNMGLRILLTNSIGLMFITVAQERLPGGFPIAVVSDQPVWFQTIAVIVTLDFFFYWMHRAKHRFGWWWRLHETHHGSVDLDWFSGVRFHPIEKITDRLIYLFPLTFLGVSHEALFILSIVDAAISSFIHLNVNVRIGPLIYLIVGPEMHRWHHATTMEGQQSNFGNNLSIFDWIFGTARLRDRFPTEFGCGDPSFPEGNFLKQFTFAFRSRARVPVNQETSLEEQAGSS